MVKVNGEEVEWKKAPNFVNNIQRKVLWKNEETGASFAILKAPKGEYLEQNPHCHPHANQFTFRLSGEMELLDGTKISISKDNYMFGYCPKDEMHGSVSEGLEVLEDVIYLHYWDGPDDWADMEGEK